MSKPVMSIDSIANLRLYEVNTGSDNGMIAQTTGYYQSNDGGCGTYYFDSNARNSDNASTVIKPDSIDSGDSGRWMLILDSINIRQFGAQCDEIDYGTAELSEEDNTARAQAAINYCASANVLKNLFIPAGTYRVTSLDLNPNRAVQGGGRFAIFGEGAVSKQDLIAGLFPDPPRTNAKGSALVASANSSVSFLACGFTDEEPDDNIEMKGFCLRDLTLVGDTNTLVLDSSQSFKSQYRNLSIQNLMTAGGCGWNLSNSDQLVVENVLIINADPDDDEQWSDGAGIWFVSDYVDGSASMFTNVQVAGYDYGFELGQQEFDSGFTYQRFNTFIGCGTDNCNFGMFLGRKWSINKFVSCAFSALSTGVQLGVTSQNVFTNCLFESTGTGSSDYGLDLGFGDGDSNRDSTQNTFEQCLFKAASTTASPVSWCVRPETTMDNIFSDCEFVGSGTSAINLVTAGKPSSTGTIIRPKFNTAELYDTYPQRFTLKPRDNAWSGYAEIKTTNDNSVEIFQFTVPQNHVITAYVTVLGKDLTGNTSHASFVRQSTFYNLSGEAAELGSAGLLAEQKQTGSGQNCEFAVIDESDKVQIKVTGVVAKTIHWACSVNLLKAS